jgi:hypothetical protein
MTVQTPAPPQDDPGNGGHEPLAGAGADANAASRCDADGRPMLVHDDYVWNLALGSNMDVEKLKTRHPSVRNPIAPLLPGVPAAAPGWILAFDLLAMPPAEPAMAGAVRCPTAGSTSVPSLTEVETAADCNGAMPEKKLSTLANSHRPLGSGSCEQAPLHGILYKLTREDYLTLSISEGCCNRQEVANPHSSYKEVVVEAIPYPEHELVKSGKVPAKVYAVVFALREPPTVPLITGRLYPSRRYLDLLIKGSKAVHLDSKYIEFLEAHPVARAPGTSMRGYTRFVFIAYFPMLFSRTIMLALRALYKRPVCLLYTRREIAHERGYLKMEWLWHVLILLWMFPLAVLGFLRAMVTRRPVLRIMKGLPG